MKLRHGWVVALLAFSSSYCYSETIYDLSQNAAASGLNWTMTNVLPAQIGLTVNAVLYRYTTVKNPEDAMIVDIRNRNALGDGYIFSSTDNWSGVPGNTIQKTIGVPGVPREAWGDGSISVTGTGLVTNQQVVYSYTFDTCKAKPLIDPMCPGYIDQLNEWLKQYALSYASPIDPLDDEFVRRSLNAKTELEDELLKRDPNDKEKKKIEEDDERRRRNRLAMKAAGNALTIAAAVSQADLINSMNNAQNFNSYYTTIAGGTYVDAIGYQPKTLPDNKTARRVGFAQQLLHEKMVKEQYELSKK